jgi:hypothetical protein
MKHHIYTLCGKNPRFLHVPVGGTRSYRVALNGYYTVNNYETRDKRWLVYH